MSDYTSPFKTGIEFLDRLGVYEILLPFLLVFTLVYAILEKSRVLGVEKINDEYLPKKNLNAMFAFVTAFLVVASSRLVATINEAVANMTVIMLLGVCFLILLGVFHTGNEEMKINDTYKNIFTIISFIGIILIFLHALKTNDGTPWLYFGWNFLVTNLDTGAVGAVILTIIVVGLMGYIVSDQKKPADTKKEN
ncbi:MAG: hypothetical protein QW757_03755 [Candidatus Woesearchaeota archaeon]